MSIIGFIKSRLSGWRAIKEPPKWVEKAYSNWWTRLPIRPYNKMKHFVGKNFIYRVRHGQGLQGEAPIIGWYIKQK